MEALCPNDGSRMVDTGRIGTSGCWTESRQSEEVTAHDIVSPPLHYAFVPMPPMAAAGHHEAGYIYTRTCPQCGLVQSYIRDLSQLREYVAMQEAGAGAESE